MPAAFAHLYFGNKALPLLPKSIADLIDENRELYDIGLHGPDIFFYYCPFKSNKINLLGSNMHYKSAKDFFAPAKEVYLSCKNKSAHLSYLLGFLAHYALDSLCHKYVAKKTAESNLAHMQIENEFDRYLLEKEGKKIVETDLTAHIIPSEINAEIISDFFESISPKEIKKSLNSMKTYSAFLNSKGIKRAATDMVVSISGMRKKIGHNFISKFPIPQCRESNLKLEELLLKALHSYPELINNYLAFLNGNQFPETLADTFDVIF